MDKNKPNYTNSSNDSNLKANTNYDLVLSFIRETLKLNLKLESISDLINTTLIYEILMTCDSDFFYSKLHLTFDQSFGILFTELSDIMNLAIKYLESSEVDLNYEFKNLKLMNVLLIINQDPKELFKFADLIVLVILNCANKEEIIEKLLSLDESIQQEVLNIIENYISVDDKDNRESLKNNLSRKESAFFNKFPNTNSDNMLSSNNNNLQRNSNQDNKVILAAEEQIKQLKDQNYKLNLENQELKFFIEAHEDNIKELEKKILNISLENSHLKDENTKLKKESLTNSSFSAQDMKFKIIDLEKILSSKEEEISRLNKTIESSKSAYASETQRLNDNLDILKHKLAISENDKLKPDNYDNKVKENEELKKKVLYYENLVSSESFKNHLSSDQVDNKKEYIEELERKVADYKDKLELLEKNYKRLKNKSNDLSKTPKKNYYNKGKILSSPEKQVFVESLDENNEIISVNNNIVKGNKEPISYSNVNTNNNFQFNIRDLNKAKSSTQVWHQEITENLDLEDADKEQADLINFRLEDVLKDNEFLKQSLVAKSEENDYLKKDITEIKMMYEREFELMTSCIYNLGVHYLNTKLDFSQKNASNPPWLTKERMKFFNGDL